MTHLIRALAFTLLSATSAAAQQAPVVVELFTSQGCSSCPPADKMMHELAGRSDVIALALHVDYWDYIGWKDEFAHPRNAERQRDYARHANRRSIYTPQMVIMGQTDIVGAKPIKLSDAIAAYKNKPQPVQVSLTREGDTIRISAVATEGKAGPMVVHFLRYQPKREARITRGENKGHTFQYANVTENWTILGDWDGREPLTMAAEAPGDFPAVVLVQAPDNGPIYGAAQLK